HCPYYIGLPRVIRPAIDVHKAQHIVCVRRRIVAEHPGHVLFIAPYSEKPASGRTHQAIDSVLDQRLSKVGNRQPARIKTEEISVGSAAIDHSGRIKKKGIHHSPRVTSRNGGRMNRELLELVSLRIKSKKRAILSGGEDRSLPIDNQHARHHLLLFKLFPEWRLGCDNSVIVRLRSRNRV